MKFLFCLIIFLGAGCASKNANTLIFPKGYEGLIAVDIAPQFPKAPKKNHGIVFKFPESGYLALREFPIDFTQEPRRARAYYTDGKEIPIQPKDGKGIFGFQGESTNHNSTIWFFYIGDKSQDAFYLGVPEGYPEQKRWLRSHNL